jgi:hypothetical protein
MNVSKVGNVRVDKEAGTREEKGESEVAVGGLCVSASIEEGYRMMR